MRSALHTWLHNDARHCLSRLFPTLFGLLISASAHAGGILVMGDSLSAGYGIDQREAWPSLLIERLKREGYRQTVTNASISGEISAGGLSRLPLLLQQTKPSIVIIELGANDGLRGLPIPKMQENLSSMIKASKSAGAQVLLIGMRMPPNLGQSYTEKFRDTFEVLAREYKTGLVPFLLRDVAAKKELFQADGLHPIASAQPLLLDTVWPELVKLLGKK